MKLLFTITLLSTVQALFGQSIIEPESLEQNFVRRRDSVKHAIEAKIDSIALFGKADSIKTKLLTKLDSVSSLKLLPSDSLKALSKLDTIQSFDLPAGVDSLQQKINQQIRKKVENGRGELNSRELMSKMDNDQKISKNINKVSEIPAPVKTNMPDVDSNTDLPNTGIPNVEIPYAELSEINTDPDIELQNTALEKPLGNASGHLEKVKDKLPTKDGIKVPETHSIDQVKNKVGGVEELSDHVSAYKDNLEQIKKGDYHSVETELEKRASDLEEVGELQNQAGEFNKLKQQKEEYEKQLQAMKDEEALKEQIKSRARKLAVNHFAEHADKLKAAQKTMAKYKRKYPSLNSIKNLPKHRPNPLKGVPFRDRFKPGFGTEVSTTDITILDLWANVGYRMTDRWNIYGGYLYRFRYDYDNRDILFNKHIYGPRVSTTYQLLKRYYVKVTLDQLRNYVPRTAKAGEFSRRWVYGGYVGIGRRQAFSGRVKATVQAMYNVLYSENTPFDKKIHIRFGFEFDLKKANKPTL